MKKLAIIIVVLISCKGFSQEKHIHIEAFKESAYPSDKFQIVTDSIALDNVILEVISVKPLSKGNWTKIFIRRTTGTVSSVNKQIMPIQESLYAGLANAGNHIYRPVPQPVPGKYFIIDCLDNTETITIINIKGGNPVKLNGYYFAISNDSSSVYSKSKDNETFYKYNLKLNKKAKLSKLPAKEVLKFHVINENEIIK